MERERPKTRAQELQEAKPNPVRKLDRDDPNSDHDIKLICVHCSATPPGWDIGAAEIDEWHKQRGWSGIGYSEVIRRNGDVEAGRAEGKELAHAKGYNKNSIAICLVGGVSEKPASKAEANFTEEQRETLKVRLGYYRLKYPNARVCGHHDLPNVNKACPCIDVQHFMDHGEFLEKV